MDRAFPIVRQPAPERRTPVLVGVPHYGTRPLPDVTRDDYSEPWFETFAYGFADTFVGDLYGDLDAQGATVLATPFSRMFVDVNRRRDDFEPADGPVRSRRGVVRTHTMRDVPIFRRPLGLADLEARLRALYDPYYPAPERQPARARGPRPPRPRAPRGGRRPWPPSSPATASRCTRTSTATPAATSWRRTAGPGPGAAPRSSSRSTPPPRCRRA